MNVPSALRFLLCFAALISIISVASAGGWDLVTVKDFPAFAEVGRPVDLTFKVWVPSLEPLAGLRPLVRATDARGHAIKSEAKASAATGEFTATLTLTDPGDWTIVFDTEYENVAT